MYLSFLLIGVYSGIMLQKYYIGPKFSKPIRVKKEKTAEKDNDDDVVVIVKKEKEPEIFDLEPEHKKDKNEEK